jgi:hypothetical protein
MKTGELLKFRYVIRTEDHLKCILAASSLVVPKCHFSAHILGYYYILNNGAFQRNIMVISLQEGVQRHRS